ncbi:MAG: hypothetical protein HY791_06315 [Deltaproteobacteria bacterium]|nr:hypothetical protein [Deltaproteobacteria bacterium]
MTLTLLALLACAPTERLALVSRVVDTATITESAVLLALSRAVEFRPQLSVVPSEALFVEETAEARILDCGPDVGCLASRLDRFGVKYGLVVVLQGRVSPLLFRAQLLDVKARRVLGSVTRRLASDRADEEIEAGLSRVLDDAGFSKLAMLVVVTTPSDAEVEVSGVEVHSFVGGSRFVRPGRARIVARAAGYESAEVYSTLIAGSAQEVRVALEKRPSLWPWIGVGAVVVTTGIVSAVILSSARSCFCLARPGIGCPTCEE